MKTRFKERYEEDLKKAHEFLTKPREKKLYEAVLEKLGRLREKHKQISACYKVEIETSADRLIVTSIKPV